MPFDATEAGRKIAADAMRGLAPGEDARTALSEFDFQVLGGMERPSIRFPFRDPVECRQHLRLTITALTELALAMERLPAHDRHGMLLFRHTIRSLNKKLNAKRRL